MTAWTEKRKIVKLNETYGLEFIPLNVILVERRRNKDGKPTSWARIGHFGSLERACVHLFDAAATNRILEGEEQVRDVRELIEFLRSVKTGIIEAVQKTKGLRGHEQEEGPGDEPQAQERDEQEEDGKRQGEEVRQGVRKRKRAKPAGEGPSKRKRAETKQPAKRVQKRKRARS